MRIGVVLAARPGIEELAVRAEELGLSSFWVYDTPMVNGDPFAALSLCAKATSRIKLGVGVSTKTPSHPGRRDSEQNER